MNRRSFLLSAAAVPVAALLPLRNGATPVEFHGIEIQRSGVYQARIYIESAYENYCRVSIDDHEIANATYAPPAFQVDMYAFFTARTGQMLHIDISAPSNVNFQVHRLGEVP